MSGSTGRSGWGEDSEASGSVSPAVGSARRMAWLGSLLLLGFPTLPAAGGAQSGELPEAIRRLEVFEGTWRAERVEFLSPDGSVRATSTARSHNALEMAGRVMVHEGRLDDPFIETRGWYYWDAEDERLRMASVASGGRYDEFAGGWDGNRLVMTTVPSAALGDRIFRMVHSELTEDSFQERLEMSEDGGTTWRTTSRQVMRRVGGDALETLAILGEYVGHWRTEDKSDQEGNPFHFEYDVRWLDPGETIVRIHIEQVLPDGARTTIFLGFKGREPSGEGVYYFATSPSGRASRGAVWLDGEALVTGYDGWAADGGQVRIRDVFSPVRNGAFRSETFLRAAPDAAWRQIGADQWRRTGPPGPGG